MILTGNKILEGVRENKIVIEPFDEKFLEPNSYGFHLNSKLLEYTCSLEKPLDIKSNMPYKELIIPPEGLVLEPGKFYLGSTYEKMGSNFYAKTLHANFSTSSMGMWIQFSAPLGHIGAIINWTLEIAVAEHVRVYSGMRIGKLAFWESQGARLMYDGKYVGSSNVVESRIGKDYEKNIEA